MSGGLPILPPSVNVFSQATLLVADVVQAVQIAANFLGFRQWGVFLDGAPVIVADNVLSVEFDQGWRLSKYPQQGGAFADYNKVATPFEIKVRFSAGGSQANRATLLETAALIAGDTNLYDVVTPEMTYENCNVVRQSYTRDAPRAGMVILELVLEQVVPAGASTFTNTQSPSGAAPVSSGLVQGGSGPANVTIRPIPDSGSIQ